MTLKTIHNLTTRMISQEEVWTFLDGLLDCLIRHGIVEVALIYGYDWGNEIYDWKDQIVEVADVPDHIKNVESMELGWLGTDDLYITVGESVQIQFCHHEELHLNYNQEDLPVVVELIEYFSEKIGLKQ